MNDEQDNQHPETSWDQRLNRLTGLGGNEVSDTDGKAELDPDRTDDNKLEDSAVTSDINEANNIAADDPSHLSENSGPELGSEEHINRLELELKQEHSIELKVLEGERIKLIHEVQQLLDQEKQNSMLLAKSEAKNHDLEMRLADSQKRFSEDWLQYTEINDVTKATRKEEWDSYFAWLGSHIDAQTGGKLVSENPLAVRILDIDVLMRAISQTDPDGLTIVRTGDGQPLILNPIDTTIDQIELTTHLALAVASALSASDVVELGSPAPEMDKKLEELVRQLQTIETEREGGECGLATHLANALLSTVSCLTISHYRDVDASVDVAEVLRGAMTAAVAWLEVILPTYSPSTPPDQRKFEQEYAKLLPRTKTMEWLLGQNARATRSENIERVRGLFGVIARGRVNPRYDRTTIMTAAQSMEKTLESCDAASLDRSLGAAIIIELICEQWSE